MCLLLTISMLMVVHFRDLSPKEVKEKNRGYYEYYCLDRTEEVPEDYTEISFVCLRPDGCLELPTTLGTVCRKVAKTLEGFEGFHFHQDVYKRQHWDCAELYFSLQQVIRVLLMPRVWLVIGI